VLNQAEGKAATGVIIPDDLIEELGHGRRPPVRVKVNGYEYRTTVGAMGGRAMVGVSAAIRKETGLVAGDKIEVELVVDKTPREVDVPADFAKALAGTPATREFFDGLSNSLQRYHVDNVNAAKTEETRQRRIDKAVALFRAGKKR
jgi:antitoxin component of MazEF toxin-antitoxin module